MAAAYIEEKVTLTPWCPVRKKNVQYIIRDAKDNREIAMYAYEGGVHEWFKHNRHKYILVDKHE